MDILKQVFGGSATTDLKSIINDGAFLVDVRTAGEFAEGNVKGSVNIPLDKVLNELTRFKDKNNIVVFLFIQSSNFSCSLCPKVASQNYFFSLEISILL